MEYASYVLNCVDFIYVSEVMIHNDSPTYDFCGGHNLCQQLLTLVSKGDN